LELFTVHHAMISYFRRFSIHYYTTIIKTTLDQDMNFFLPSANIKEKNDAVSRRANSFGISTTYGRATYPVSGYSLKQNSQQ